MVQQRNCQPGRLPCPGEGREEAFIDQQVRVHCCQEWSCGNLTSLYFWAMKLWVPMTSVWTSYHSETKMRGVQQESQERYYHILWDPTQRPHGHSCHQCDCCRRQGKGGLQWGPQTEGAKAGVSEVQVLVAQSYPTLCNPMDCSLPGSSVHGILQARILKWVALPFSRGSSWLRDRTWVSCTAAGFFTIWAIRDTQGGINLAYLRSREGRGNENTGGLSGTE